MGTDNSYPTSEDLARAARAVYSHDFGPEALELLRRIALEDSSAEDFICHLVHEGGLHGLNYEDSAAQAEHDLDLLFDKDEMLACIFMAYLWPVTASIIGMHQESDSIELHIDGCHVPELLTRLELMASKETDTNIKARYEDWISAKKSKSNFARGNL